MADKKPLNDNFPVSKNIISILSTKFRTTSDYRVVYLEDQSHVEIAQIKAHTL